MIGDWLAERAVALYRGLAFCLEPLAGQLLSYRQRRGKEDPSRQGERFGLSDINRPEGSLIWVHAASVGETNAVLPLIEKLIAADHFLLLTTGTLTSAGVADRHIKSRKKSQHMVHQYVPLDFPRAVGRFLDHWRPDAALFMESELWPVIIDRLQFRKIPLIIVNARMSDRSWRTWSKFGLIAKAILSPTNLVLAQSENDAERYHALGARRVMVTGNLKFDAPAPDADSAILERYRRIFSAKSVIMAASTHEGEEAALFSAAKSLQSEFQDVVILVAPRHPDRGTDVLDQAKRAGFVAGLRSKGGEPGDILANKAGEPVIYIADTIGELGLWYRLSDLVLMGGTLSERGGQNPIEAANLGVPVIHGPNVWNFSDIFAGLDKAEAALPIAGIQELPAALSHLMRDPDARERMAGAARDYVGMLKGASDRTMNAIQPLLDEGRKQ